MSPSGPVANTGRWLKAALEARAQRDFERAQGCLAQATREAAGDARALALVGDVQSQLADYPAAYAAYDAALTLAPTQSALWFNRAAVARFWLFHLDRTDPRLDGAHGIVAMANHPLTAVRKNKFGIRCEKSLKFRLDRLGDQPARASTQDFGERIVDFVFLAIGNNIMIGQGVTLLVGGSGRFGHQPRYAAFLTASPIFPHSSRPLHP